jgi:multiple sugar transport system substrate-binding protein
MRRGQRDLWRRDFLIGAGAASLAAGALAGRARAAAEEPIHFVTWSAAVDQVKSHLTAFEQKTGINVDYSNSPWANYRETLVTKFVAGAPIDTLWVSDAWLPEWADAGWIQPIDQYPELTKFNGDVTRFCNESMTYKGRQYGLTYYSDHMAFYYVDDMLKKAAITAPPQSWDEVTEQALKIKKAGISEYPVMLALARETWLIEFLSAMVFSHGGRFTDEHGMAVMDVPGTGCLEALKWIVDAVNVHKIVSPGCVEAGELTGLKAFSSGNHAFALEPQYRMRTINDPKQSQVGGRVKQVLMPKGPNGSHATVGWMRFYGMTPQAQKDKARAAEVVKLIEWFGGKAEGSYAFQKLVFLDIGAGFCTKPLYHDPDIIKAYNTYGDATLVEQQAELARKKDVVTSWFGEWNEINGQAWQEAILKKVTPEDALKRSAESWNKLKKEAS